MGACAEAKQRAPEEYAKRLTERRPHAGTVFEEGFFSLWSGARMQDFRRRVLRNKASIPLCRTCQRNSFAGLAISLKNLKAIGLK